ncbi:MULTISPECIES: hypothetical protein [Pedobacter]|uniref:Lipoprotein n=1 Tax=Pedobacter montanisoli TaxID=2923277 RepID=A0ABS9ZUP7_9SPHI|nr:hypothetical protein [Pedobacter montanisoli]MCJ0741669.1 hypothetical protein [Pedobacter montanisoli]
MKTSKTLFLLTATCLFASGCELFEAEPEEEKKVDNSTYTYTYTCPTGRTNTVQIPNRLSATCKRNWEYYARTYGCNDADNFSEANRRKAECP